MSSPCRPRSQDRSDGGVNGPDTRILRKRTNLFCFPKYLIPAKKAYTFSKTFCFNTSKVHLFPIKTTKMMIKQLIYDSCMIVKKETIISACYDIQSSHKKHDGMIVVFQIFLLLAYVCLLIYIHDFIITCTEFSVFIRCLYNRQFPNQRLLKGIPSL